jgi:hypothetical protein
MQLVEIRFITMDWMQVLSLHEIRLAYIVMQVQ